jgi:transposase InsO family protein
MDVAKQTVPSERRLRVKLHRNAKTTPHMRALLVHRVQTLQWSVAAATGAAGVAIRTGYEWLARHRHGGTLALQDRSSQPRRQPRRTSPAIVEAILASRRERLTAWAIAVRLQVPRSTVARILARHGLNRLRSLEPAAPVIRYERTRPGELVHLDIKPLARILRVGHRIHGDRRQIVYGAGYEYAHVAIDDHSRVAYVEVLPDQRGTTTAGFLRRTTRWFARRGVRIERVLTDNGSAYISDAFHHVAQAAQIRLIKSRPHHPQTNGKAERFIQTMRREWAYAVPYLHSWKRTRALKPWLRVYNTLRRHSALGYQPPCIRFPRAAQ